MNVGTIGNMSNSEELIDKLNTQIDSLTELISSNKRKDWMKTEEAMEYLGVSESQLYKLRAQNTLPYTKLAGTIYYDREDIDAILERNKVTAFGSRGEQTANTESTV